MVPNSNVKGMFKYILIMCTMIHIKMVHCNISGINRIVKTTTRLKTMAPRVCNTESLPLMSNGVKLGFINRAPKFNKYKYSSYGKYDRKAGESLPDSSKNYEYNPRAGLALQMKPNTRETQHTQAAKRDVNRSVVFDRLFSSPWKGLKEAVSKADINELFSTVSRVAKVGLWYAGNVGIKREMKELLNLFPLPRSLVALQQLASLPLVTFRWLLGLEPPPSFNVPQYQVEKVDYSKDGLIKSVKKRLMNGYNRTKSYIRAYKSVLVQAGCHTMLNVLSTSKPLFRPDVNFFRVLEPVFVSLLTYLFEGTKLPALEYLSLVPVVAGLVYSNYQNRFGYGSFVKSLKDPSSLKAYGLVILYNVFRSLRKIESNRLFEQNIDKLGSNITHSNINTAVTLLSTLMYLPFALLEWSEWREAYEYLFKNYGNGKMDFLKHLGLSTLHSFMVNYGSFETMHKLSPVTQSLLNSIQVSFSNLLDTFFFDRKLSKQELLGSYLSIAGGLLYSIVKKVS